MKKLIALFAGVMLASIGWAQVDSAALQHQQEELLKQQQKEQQELLEKQQKEEQRVMKEQQKEQEQQLKQQAKEQEREQQELQAKQEKALRKAERRESIQRNFYLSVDPYYVSTINTNWNDKRDPYHSGTMLWRGYRGDFVVGADVMMHAPLNKHWNLDLGVGYVLSRFAYTNDVAYDTLAGVINLASRADGNEVQYNAFLHTIEVPLLLSFTGKDSTWNETYFGVRFGCNLQANYRERSWDAENNAVVTPNVDMMKAFNPYQLKVVFGHQSKTFVFSPGWELYFNLLPTYVDANTSVREIGILYKL